MIKVMIVYDQALIREGLNMMLELYDRVKEKYPHMLYI